MPTLASQSPLLNTTDISSDEDDPIAKRIVTEYPLSPLDTSMPVSVLSEHSLEHIPHAPMDYFPTFDKEPNLEDQPQSHEDDPK